MKTLDETIYNIYIVIPIYNTKQYLNKCIRSVLNQSYYDIFIILVDDGSTDGSSELCDYYARLDERIHVIHKENGGLSDAKNNGLDYLYKIGAYKDNNSYVSFIDSDDFVDSRYIEHLLKIAIDSNADIVQGGYYFYYSDNRCIKKYRNVVKKNYSPYEAIECVCYNSGVDVASWGKLYRLKLYNNIRFPVGRLYEDTAVACLLFKKANGIFLDSEPLYYYVQRRDSIANGVNFSSRKIQFVEVGDEVAKFVIEYNPKLIKAAVVKQIFVRLSTLSQMVNSNFHNDGIIQQYRHFVIKNATCVLVNCRVPIRTKLGVILICMGWRAFKYSWKIYYSICKREE